MTASGTIIASLASGVAHDAAGNASTASTSTDNTVTFDSAGPSVTVNQASGQADPTKGTPVNFTVVFSESVSDFATGDVTITGTAGGTKTVTVTGSGMAYNVAVSGMTTSGTVIASLAAGVAHDVAGNASTASTSTDNTVTYDNVGPTIALTFPTTATSFGRNTTALTLKGTADDLSSIASVSCSVNGAAAVPCTGTSAWDASYVTLHSGDNVIAIGATDGLGNTSTMNLSVKVLDSTPGAAWTGNAMISLPIIPDVTDPKPVVGFNSNGWYAYGASVGAYIPYSDHKSWFEPKSTTPGRGFWAYFPASGSASPCGTIPPQDSEARIHLSIGWNLIGTPFINPVPWDLSNIQVEKGGTAMSLAAAADTVDGWCWGWDSASGAYYLVYDASIIPGARSAIEPWLGYWIRAKGACDLVLPAP